MSDTDSTLTGSTLSSSSTRLSGSTAVGTKSNSTTTTERVALGATAAGNPSAGAMLGAPFSYGGGPNFSRLTTTESISTINQRSTIKKAANQAASNARQRGS